MGYEPKKSLPAQGGFYNYITTLIGLADQFQSALVFGTVVQTQ